jgi:hypothetical protein
MVGESRVVGAEVAKVAVTDLEGFFLEGADFRLPWKVTVHLPPP